jgi:hypothetical protein
MIETEVKPLHTPGKILSGDTHFICNIGDEISLFRINGSLRVYVAYAHGIWLYNEDDLDELIAEVTDNKIYNLNRPLNQPESSIIVRHADIVRVYMRMLGKGRPPVD